MLVNGSTTVSSPISTSTSITVAAGSTIVTPASMWRRWIACWATARTSASAARSLTPSTRLAVFDPVAHDARAIRVQQLEHLRQVELLLSVVGAEARQHVAQRPRARRRRCRC